MVLGVVEWIVKERVGICTGCRISLNFCAVGSSDGEVTGRLVLVFPRLFWSLIAVVVFGAIWIVVVAFSSSATSWSSCWSDGGVRETMFGLSSVLCSVVKLSWFKSRLTRVFLVRGRY